MRGRFIRRRSPGVIMSDKKYSEGDIVEVRFSDVRQSSEWIRIELIPMMTPTPAKTIGYFLGEDEKCIRIVTMVCKDEEGAEASPVVIPKGLIDSINLIQESEIDDFE